MDIKNLSEETKKELLNLIIQDINIDGVTEYLKTLTPVGLISILNTVIGDVLDANPETVLTESVVDEYRKKVIAIKAIIEI